MNKKQINLFINNVKNLINKFDSYKNLKELEKQKNFYIKHNYSPDLLTTIDALDEYIIKKQNTIKRKYGEMILNDLTKFLNSYKDFIIKNTDMFSNNEEINKEQNSFNLLYDKNTADEKENSFEFFYDQEEPEEKINSLKTLTPSTKEEKQLSKEEFHNFLCQIMAFIEKINTIHILI